MAKMDLSDDNEKVNIETIFWSAMDMLSDDDTKLPQVRVFHITSNISCSSYYHEHTSYHVLIHVYVCQPTLGFKYAAPVETRHRCTSLWFASHTEGSH